MFEPDPLVIEPPANVEIAADAASRAAAHWHLPAPTLIRLGATGVFRAGDVVLRVCKATAPAEVSLALARQLQSLGLRVTTPVRNDVVRVNDLSVTAWEFIEEDVSATRDWEQVGAMVRVLHGIDPAPLHHPMPFCGDFPWWNISLLLDEVAFADPIAAAALHEAYASNAWWYATARTGRLVLCHGDVHPGNVLHTAKGPVLIDWDLLSVGPPEWDHAPLMTWTSRWGGESGVYEAFAHGYGLAVDLEIAEAISKLRLVAATLMRLRAARLRPDNGEAQRRLAYWRGEPNAAQWRAV